MPQWEDLLYDHSLLGQFQLWFCGLSALHQGWLWTWLYPLLASYPSAPKAIGESCSGLLHVGLSPNPWTASLT